MRKALTATAAILALAGTTLGAAAPAEARRGYNGGGHYGGGYYGGRGYGGRGYYGGRGGAAIGAGILGLAVGAAIASNRGYGYGGGYGGGGYYGGAPAYYAPPPAPYGYYDGGYCHADWRWDGYRGRYVRVEFCD